jgi:DNA-binding GntR family transcriptional regulator
MSAIPSALEILQSKSLPCVVRDEIMRLILRGTYSPGSKLGEEELATLLGVSRGPIREAFRSLEEAKLVQLSKNRGVFVREINAAEAGELYVVRRGLDEMIGRLIAPTITDDEVTELRRMIEEMELSFTSQDIQEYFPRDMAFHDRIAQIARNSKLLEIHRRVVNEMHLVRLQSIQRGGGLLVSNHEHTAIVDALETRDPDAAAGAMGQHVVLAFQRVAPLLTPTVASESDTKSATQTRASQ